MVRTVSARLAALVTATALTLPTLLHAQKALVYCPVGIDAAGCTAIVSALAGDAARFPGGADAGYDGTQGSVDLATVDLAGYAVFVVPSLADGPDVQPYALLRNATIAGRLQAAFMGRAAVWSGTPDVGSTNRAAKDQLLRNLAAWARPDSAGTHGPGVVALQDNSDDGASRYGWLAGISALAVTADTTFDVYSNVQALTSTAQAILASSSGTQIGYANMASMGLVRASAGAVDDASGARTARVVLVTTAGDPSDPNMATVSTDKDDYVPGDTVTVTGAGWLAGETVSLLIHEDSTGHPDQTLSAVADEAGHIFNHQFAIDSSHIGVRFWLTATGLTSGKIAQTTFTDLPRIAAAVTVGAQVGTLTTGTAGSATFLVTPTRAANGTVNGTFSVTTALPSGVSVSFSPATFTANGGTAFPSSTLTVTITAAAAAGSFTLNVRVADGTDQGNGTATVTINKRNQTITFTSTAPSGALVGGTYTATATATSGLGVAIASSTPSVCTGSGTGSATISFIAAGTCTLTADQAGNATFNPAPQVIQSFTVSKQNQTITFTSTAPTNALVGGTYTATATASSGLPVTLASSTTSVCTGSGTNSAVITFITSGTCTVTANQGGNATFNPAAQVTQSFSVFTGTTTTLASSPNPSNPGQSVTFTATVKTTGGTPVGVGTVNFVSGATCAGTVLQSNVAVSGGTASFSTTSLSVGQNTVTACYSGTATFAASSGSTTHRVNALPVITGVPATATIPELAPYTFDANATDADSPPDPLTFSLVGGPTGSAIDPTTGVFTWTPTEAQGPGSFTFAVRVSDGIGNTDAPITLTVTEVNEAPILAAIGNKSVNELATLSFTATATDADLPAQTLTFTLDAGAPAGAAITSAGAFSWTPTEAQGPGDYPVTVRVSDGVADRFETISIHVDEVNQAPVVAAIADKTVDELTELTFTATATDGDLPAQTVTFDLVGAPAGATITPAGAFSWTPTEAQGPGVYTFQVRATDDFTTPAAGTTTVKVTVNEVNEPPVLTAIGNQTVNELVQLAFTATATDPDLPANTLAFSLDAGSPAGAAITSAGAFTWTPTEAQGPGDYPVTIRVSDGTATDFETISIHVDEVNQAPVVAAIADQTVDELTELTFTATATDADLPANSFTFSLADEPAGATITAAGAFSWTPTEAQGPGVYTFKVVATDNGTPALAGETIVKVTVSEVNVAPELAAIGNKSVDEETALTFTASATDADVPANTLTYALVGAPAGASINASSGAFTWTPTEAQGPNSYTFTVKVTDNGSPALADEEEITVTVNEVNKAPIVDPVADQTVDEETELTFTATATDPDIPANSFTFSLADEPAGATITAAGAFSWTPSEAQGPGDYTFKVVATDNGTPALAGETTVKVTVNEVNKAPTLTAIGNKTVDEETALTFTASATDPDLPANTLSYALVGAPAGASINGSSGAFSWTPTEAQGPGSYTFTVKVTDDGTPALSDEEEITVTVNEVNKAPIVDPIADQTVDEETELTFTATATDPDVPANAFLFSLSGAPSGAAINPSTGAFSWTPSEAQGPGVYTFQVVATDNGSPSLAGQTTVKVTVNEVNLAPELTAIGNKSVDEETALTFTASATDADLPANTLTFSLVGAPSGASITSAGAFTWTPTEAQGPNSYTFKVRVTDNGSPALADEEEITVTVNEINKAPIVDPIADQTVDEETELTFTATATDPDVPANSFNFSLADEPVGATITAAGAFSWTPTEAQGPGVYTFKVLATDNGSPALTGETTVKVTVNEVNRDPVLAAIGNKTVNEETALSFTASATDPDLPANTLTYALVGAPAGAGINASSGAFTWTPTEAQGPGSYTFTVKVTDNGSPALSDQEEITVTVNEVNVAPQVVTIGNKVVDELALLSFTATATDQDIPANTLTFSLDAGAPAGASITTGGAFTWTPTEAQGPGDYPVTVRVTDNGSPALSGTETITIHVNEVNVAPELAAIGNKTVGEETALTFTASATDADLPANGLAFSLIGAPAGAAINATSGVFGWTPSEAQGPGSYTFKVRVTDNGSPALADEEEITVTVNEVNKTPVLAAIANVTAPWGTAVSFTANGSDPDLPANTLTYSLQAGAPAGAAINPTSGAFSWTPGIADVGPHSITVRVTDNGSPVMFAEQSFTVTVEKHLTSVVYSGTGTGVYGSTAGLSATLTDVTTGTPISGKSIGFTIGALGTTATTQSGGAAGLATAALSLAQNVGAYSVVSTFTEDAAYKGSTDSDPFSITPAPLSVKADNKTMFYGAATRPPFTVAYTGFVLSQSPSALGGSLTFVGSAASVNGSSPVGNYTITPTGLTSSNYAISYTSGTLAVIYNNVAGHQFLQPINPNLTTGNRSSFKIGSTIPTKFQLFKADGTTVVTTAAATISVVRIDTTPDTPINEDMITMPPDDGVNFRVSGGQYIYNLGTKNWIAGTYRITATLDDGSKITAEVDGRSK